MSLSHKLWFSNHFIQCRRPLIFQTLNHVRPIILDLKHQRFTPSGCKGLHHQVAKVYTIRFQRFTPSGCKGLHHQVAKVVGLESLSFWQIVKKISTSIINLYDLDLDLDLDPGLFISIADPGSGSGSASKLNGSLKLLNY